MLDFGDLCQQSENFYIHGFTFHTTFEHEDTFVSSNDTFYTMKYLHIFTLHVMEFRTEENYINNTVYLYLNMNLLYKSLSNWVNFTIGICDNIVIVAMHVISSFFINAIFR
jgi:hypothetical protein